MKNFLQNLVNWVKKNKVFIIAILGASYAIIQNLLRIIGIEL